MTHKKNGFLNFWCSMVPGCGQMYQGFMKRGFSLMSIFFGVIFIAGFFNMDTILLALPVVWAVAFFDSIHCNSLTLEERAIKKDDFLLMGGQQVSWDIFRKYRVQIASVIIFFAGYAFLISFYEVLRDMGLFGDSWKEMYYLRYYVPRFVVSAAVVVLGVRMILGKKRAIDEIETQEGRR